MATIEQARTQVTQARQQVVQSRQQLEQRRAEIPKTTQRQLRQQEGIAGRELQRRLAEQRAGVEEELGKVKQFEKQIGKAEEEIKKAEAAQAAAQAEQARHLEAINVAKKWAARGKFPAGESKLVQKYFSELTSEQRAIENLQAEARELGVAMEGKTATELAKTISKLKQDLKVPKIEEAVITEVPKPITTKLQVPAITATKILTPEEGLKAIQAIKPDGKPDVLPRVSRRTGILGAGISLVRDIIGDTRDRTRDRDQAKEIYSPELGGFVQARDTTPKDALLNQTGIRGVQVFGQQTAIIRRPTLEEEKTIREADIKGEIISIPAKEIVRRTRRFEDLTKDFDKLEGAALDERLRQLREIGANIQMETTDKGVQYTVQEPTVGVGFGLDKRQVSISRLDTRRKARVVTSALALSFGEMVGDISRKVGLPKRGLPVTTPVGIFTPGIKLPETDISKGRLFPPKKIQVTPSGIAMAGEIGVRSILFVPEEAATIAETIKAEKRIGKGVLTFIKESPIETATIGLGAGLGLGKLGLRALRLTKEARFISEPLFKSVEVEQKFAKVVTKKARKVPKAEIRVTDDLFELALTAKEKGATRVTKFKPGEFFEGTVTEIRKAPLFRKPKEFKGVVRIGKKGERLEVLKLRDDFFRVTKIGKEGKGTISLVKKGTTKFEKAIEAVDLVEDLGKVKLKTEKIKVDVPSGQQLSMIQTEIKTPSKTLRGKRVTTPRGDIVITDITQVPPSKRVVGELETITRRAQDIRKGRIMIQQDVTGFADIIRVGPRKGLVQRKVPAGDITFKAQVGQKIEFGVDKSIDKATKIFRGKKRVIKKIVSPRVEREITQFGGTRLTDIFVDPRIKSVKARRIVEEAKAKALRKAIAKENIQIQKEIKRQMKALAKTEKAVGILPGIPTPPAFPTMVGGEGGLAAQSIFAFDRASILKDIGRTTFVPPTPQFLVSPPRVAGIRGLTDVTLIGPERLISDSLVGMQILGGVTKLDVQPRVLTRTLQLQPQIKTKVATKEVTRLFVGPTTKVITRVKPVVETKFGLKLDLKLKTQQKLKQALKTRAKLKKGPTPKEKFKPRPRLRPRPKLRLVPLTIKVPTARQKVKEVFKVFARKAGVDIEIARAPTKRKAFRELRKKLKRTLRASGFVERAGEKVRPTEFGAEFRPGKIDPFRLVQVRERRLGTKQEVSEIQFFRKTKSRGPTPQWF